jgi:hypothetical protein
MSGFGHGWNTPLTLCCCTISASARRVITHPRLERQTFPAEPNDSLLGLCAIGIDFITRLLERDPAGRMRIDEALGHDWLSDGGSSHFFERDSTVGLSDTPRMNGRFPSGDDFSQPMNRLRLQTPGQMSVNRRNFFSLDSSQGQLAGQSSVFANDSSPNELGDVSLSNSLLDLNRQPPRFVYREDYSASQRGTPPPGDPFWDDPEGYDHERQFIPDTQAKEELASSVPDTQAKLELFVPETQNPSQAESSAPAPASEPIVLDANASGDEDAASDVKVGGNDAQVQDDMGGAMEVDIELQGVRRDRETIVNEDSRNDARGEKRQSQEEDRTRAVSSPLSSAPSSPAQLMKASNEPTSPSNPTGPAHEPRRLRTQTHPSKQRPAESMEDSPRPKKRAATMSTKSQVQEEPSSTRSGLGSLRSDVTGRTRSSARLRRK